MRLITYITTTLALLLPVQGEQPTRPGGEIEKPTKPNLPARPTFPKHWGHPPKIQTRDMVKLPGKFGRGSSTLAKWIAGNLKKDADKRKPVVEKPKPQPKPKRPKRPEPAIDVKEKIAIVIAREKEMQKIRKDFHDILKNSKDATKETREALIKEFKEANADKHQALKEAQKELQKKIRETKQDGARRK